MSARQRSEPQAQAEVRMGWMGTPQKHGTGLLPHWSAKKVSHNSCLLPATDFNYFNVSGPKSFWWLGCRISYQSLSWFPSVYSNWSCISSHHFFVSDLCNIYLSNYNDNTQCQDACCSFDTLVWIIACHRLGNCNLLKSASICLPWALLVGTNNAKSVGQTVRTIIAMASNTQKADD